MIPGNIPVVACGKTPPYYHNVYNRSGETIAVSGSGDAGYVSYWKMPIFLSGSFSIKPNSEILITKYVFHFLKSIQNEIYSKQKASGIPHVYASDLKKFIIPIPSISIQKQIVYVLDKLEFLINNYIQGLQTEIESRKKQYDYYRGQLVNFN